MKVFAIGALIVAMVASEPYYSKPATASATNGYQARPEAPGVAAGGYGANAVSDDKAYGYAPTPYSFGYSVNDDYASSNYGHQETGDGNGSVAGRYQVLLPDGRLQIVTYKAEKYKGFVSEVKYVGEAKHDYSAAPVAAYASTPVNYASAPAKPVAQAPVKDSYYPTLATYYKPSTSAPAYNPTTQAPVTTYRTTTKAPTTTYKPTTQAPAFNPTTSVPSKESYYPAQAPPKVAYKPFPVPVTQNYIPAAASVAYRPSPAASKVVTYKPISAKPAVVKPVQANYAYPAASFPVPVQGKPQATSTVY